MTERVHLLLVGLGVFVVLALSGANCNSGEPGKCTNDFECGEFRACDTGSGECLCTDDRACNAGDTCNGAGRCQPKSGCFSNKDCKTDGEGCENQFCDTIANTCISVCECSPESGETCCTLDSQCAFGEVCNRLGGVCVPGCNEDGDCRLGEGCVKETIGALGTCAAGFCTANNLCDFGEACDLESGECVFDTRGPFCSSCAGGVLSDDCGERGNYCLTDSTDPTGQSSFCGVDCAQGQACPFGYSCNEVIIIPRTLPFCSAPEICLKSPGETSGVCSRYSTVTCSVDEDCPEGPPGSDCPRYNFDCEAGDMCPGGSACPASGRCPPFGHCLVGQNPCEQDVDCCDDPAECPSGSCVLQRCVGREGSAFGHCTCTVDSDCPNDDCEGADLSDPQNPQPGRCFLSGRTCFEDIDCNTIACVDGGCRIGSNCAPANDRSCRELQSVEQ